MAFLDQENPARTATGGHPGIEMQKGRTELNLGKAEETMIGIVIDAMIGTGVMTVTGIEIMTAPVAMIQGEGNALDPGSAAAGTATWFLLHLISYPVALSLLASLANPDCSFAFQAPG